MQRDGQRRTKTVKNLRNSVVNKQIQLGCDVNFYAPNSELSCIAASSLLPQLAHLISQCQCLLVVTSFTVFLALQACFPPCLLCSVGFFIDLGLNFPLLFVSDLFIMYIGI